MKKSFADWARRKSSVVSNVLLQFPTQSYCMTGVPFLQTQLFFITRMLLKSMMHFICMLSVILAVIAADETFKRIFIGKLFLLFGLVFQSFIIVLNEIRGIDAFANGCRELIEREESLLLQGLLETRVFLLVFDEEDAQYLGCLLRILTAVYSLPSLQDRLAILRDSFHTIRAKTLLKVMEVQFGEDIDIDDKVV